MKTEKIWLVAATIGLGFVGCNLLFVVSTLIAKAAFGQLGF